MRSEWVAKGLILQILKNSTDRDDTTCQGSLLHHLTVLMEKINAYFCIEQGQEWTEGFPVVSPLAAVLSGARTGAEGDTFFSCSLLLALRKGEKAVTETQADMKTGWGRGRRVRWEKTAAEWQGADLLGHKTSSLWSLYFSLCLLSSDHPSLEHVAHGGRAPCLVCSRNGCAHRWTCQRRGPQTFHASLLECVSHPLPCPVWEPLLGRRGTCPKKSNKAGEESGAEVLWRAADGIRGV